MSDSKKLFLLFILSAVVGQLAVLAVVYINNQDPAIGIGNEKVRQLEGIIESIDQQSDFLILDIAETYEYDITQKQKRKIYFDKNTLVLRQDLLEEDGVIYFQTDPVSDSIKKLRSGDRASILFTRESERSRFYALYIIHGTPFPSI